MINVTGFYQPNLVWDDITNEDHVQAIIRFAGGEVVATERRQTSRCLTSRKLVDSGGNCSVHTVQLPPKATDLKYYPKSKDSRKSRR